MKELLLSAALALAAGAIEPQEPSRKVDPAEEHEVEPSAPPKAPIAGMTGFRSKSRVIRSSSPDQVLLLETFYVFPERVRWSLIPAGAPASQRQLEYRLGESYWSVEPGGTKSGRIHRWTKLHMELRRALMLWPDGFAWEGEGPERHASSPVREQILLVESPPDFPLVLFAQLDEAGRPRQMQVHYDTGDGETFDTKMALRDITWREQGDRWWPDTFTLVDWSDVEWHETVESVDVGVNAIDSFFVPPDRRDASGMTSPRTAAEVVLPAVLQRRVALPDGTRWEAALAEARRLAQEEETRLEPLGGRLETDVFVELDVTAAPRAVLLRLAQAPSTLPEEWAPTPPRRALTTRVSGSASVQPGELRRLRAQVPAGATPQAAYVRLGEAAGQLVQPYQLPR